MATLAPSDAWTSTAILVRNGRIRKAKEDDDRRRVGAEGTSRFQRTVTLTDVNESVRVEHAHLRLEPELVTRLQASVGLRKF